MQKTNQVSACDNLLSDIVLRRKRRERLLTEPIPMTVIRDIRQDMNMNELRIVESVTKAKRKLQCKYYQRRPIEVQSIDESIHDKISFDRRLKLFLHRQKKPQLLSYLDRPIRSRHQQTLSMTKDTEVSRLKQMVAPKWKIGSSKKLVDSTMFFSQFESPAKQFSRTLRDSKIKITQMPKYRYDPHN